MDKYYIDSNKGLEWSDLSVLEKGLMSTGLFTTGFTFGLQSQYVAEYAIPLALIVSVSLLGTNALLVRDIKNSKNKKENYEIK